MSATRPNRLLLRVAIRRGLFLTVAISLVMLTGVAGAQARGLRLSVVTTAPTVGQPVVIRIRPTSVRGQKKTYRVSYGDGTSRSGRRVPWRLSHVFLSAGTFRVSLRIGGGRRARRASATVAVNAADSGPTPAGPFPSGVPVICSSDLRGSITLSTMVSGRLQTFASLDEADLKAKGWTWTNGQDPVIRCYPRRAFSADFSTYVFAASPPGGKNSSANNHIGIIDVRTGSVTDLTAPRQGAGFSAPLLNELGPLFLGAGGDRVTFGSDVVVFTTGYEQLAGGRSQPTYATVAVATPAQSTPITARTVNPWGSIVPGDHFEMQADGSTDQTGAGYPLSNPDGTLLVSNGKIWPLKHPDDGAKDISCPGYSGGAALGWRDSTHLVLSDSDALVRIATLSADGTVQSCRDPIPPTSKTYHDPYLSLDRQSVHFGLDGINGVEPWAVSIQGDTQHDPTSTPFEVLPDHSVIYLTGG